MMSLYHFLLQKSMIKLLFFSSLMFKENFHFRSEFQPEEVTPLLILESTPQWADSPQFEQEIAPWEFQTPSKYVNFRFFFN